MATHAHPTHWIWDGRVIAALAAAVVTAGALSGEVSGVLFNQPSLLKFVLTVAGPAMLVVLLGIDRAPLVLGVMVLLVGPFALYTNVAGFALSPVTALLVVAALVTRWQQPSRAFGSSTALGRAVLVLPVCLAVPLVEGSSRGLYLELLLSGLGSAYVFSRLGRDPENLRILLFAFVGSATIQGALACWEFVTGHQLNIYGNSGNSFGTDYFFAFDNVNRAAAAMSDPIALGNVLAMAFPITVCVFFFARSVQVKACVAGAAVILIIGLVSTLSRMSWIGATAGAVVAFALLRGRQRVIAITGVLGIIVVAIGLSIGVGGDAVTARFNSISDPTSSQVRTAAGDEARLQLQHTALRVAEAHPITGVGFGNLAPYLIASVPGATKGTHAHSTYYNVLAEAGALGGIVILAVLLGALADAVRGASVNRTAVAGLLGSVVAMALVWSTDYTIRNIQVIVMMAAALGLLSAVAWTAKQRDSERRWATGSIEGPTMVGAAGSSALQGHDE